MKLKITELFAGIGAWSKALQNLNIDHEVIDVVEINPKTIEAYNLIHNLNYEPSDIAKRSPKSYSYCDILFYSPPCQSWSSSGNEQGFEDDRGILFFDALYAIKAIRPKILIMENVANLTKPKFKNEFQTILNLLRDVGYYNEWSILNANNFGSAQSRERTIVVSIRNDVVEEFSHFSFDNLEFNKKTNCDFIESNVDGRYYKVLESDNSILNPILGIYNNRTGFNIKDYTCTLDASYGKGIGCRQNRIAVKDSKGIRALTEREGFRIMGFDDRDYEKVKHINKTALYTMAGNSISIELLEGLFKELFKKYILK